MGFYNTVTDRKNGEKLMYTTSSSKFQVVIPKPARETLKLKPKQKLTVIEKDSILILLPQVTLESLRGIAKGAKIHDYRDKKRDRY
jgi:AbrB family looped-hinge helix DNA binding protein